MFKLEYIKPYKVGKYINVNNSTGIDGRWAKSTLF